MNLRNITMVWTDLHELCASPDHTKRHQELLLAYLRLHPEEASEEYDDGTLPLHHLLQNDPPLKLVTKLVEAYPESVFVDETIKGYYPLHVACRHGCSVPVVDYLINRNPQALYKKSRRFFICCIEEIILLCLGRGLEGWSCEDMVKALPEGNPNRQPLLELLHSHYMHHPLLEKY
jgi:hypothetical protein